MEAIESRTRAAKLLDRRSAKQAQANEAGAPASKRQRTVPATWRDVSVPAERLHLTHRLGSSVFLGWWASAALFLAACHLLQAIRSCGACFVSDVLVWLQSQHGHKLNQHANGSHLQLASQPEWHHRGGASRNRARCSGCRKTGGGCLRGAAVPARGACPPSAGLWPHLQGEHLLRGHRIHTGTRNFFFRHQHELQILASAACERHSRSAEHTTHG